jgi:hypothetical protein
VIRIEEEYSLKQKMGINGGNGVKKYFMLIPCPVDISINVYIIVLFIKSN